MLAASGKSERQGALVSGIRVNSYVRVYTEGNGAAAFEDLEVAPNSVDPTLAFSDQSPVSTIFFARGEPGRARAQAPEPRRNWVIGLMGSCDITASGESRTLRPGDVMLFEDIDGSGHTSFTRDGYSVAVIPL